MSSETTTAGKFVWHEQVSPDPKQAQDFSTRLFGWGTEVFQPGEADYVMIAAGGRMHGGFGQAREGAPPPHWLSHVAVEDVDETTGRVQGAGGRLAASPFDTSEVGRMAIASDPQGGFLGIYQAEGEMTIPEGVFV